LTGLAHVGRWAQCTRPLATLPTLSPSGLTPRALGVRGGEGAVNLDRAPTSAQIRR
jgi:hypothetical protein